MRSYIFKFSIVFSFALSQQESNIDSLYLDNGIYKLSSLSTPFDGLVFKIKDRKKLRLGKMINGKKNGSWKEWYPNKRLLIENYKNGLLYGPVSLFFKNGQKEWRYNYVNGKLNGIYTKWYKNGQKSVEGYFEKGEKSGPWNWWDDKGNILKTENYMQVNDIGLTNYNQYVHKTDKNINTSRLYFINFNH